MDPGQLDATESYNFYGGIRTVARGHGCSTIYALVDCFA